MVFHYEPKHCGGCLLALGARLSLDLVRHAVNTSMKISFESTSDSLRLLPTFSNAWHQVSAFLSRLADSQYRVENAMTSLDTSMRTTIRQLATSRAQSAELTMFLAGSDPINGGFEAEQTAHVRITTLQEFMASARARTWSLVLNFNDSGGQQVSKSLSRCNQTSCMHGLWFGLAHQPTSPTVDDFNFLGSTGVGISTFGDSLLPMHDQNLIREFTRHGAELDAATYCKAIVWAAHNQSKRMVTYLRSSVPAFQVLDAPV